MHWLPDVNVWLAMTLDGHRHHRLLREWMDGLPVEDHLYFCRTTQAALLRLLTTEAVLSAYGRKALTNKEAWRIWMTYAAVENIGFADEPGDLEERWRSFAARSTASPKLWMDAYLAAFAVESGLKMITTDKAFTQFIGTDILILE